MTTIAPVYQPDTVHYQTQVTHSHEFPLPHLRDLLASVASRGASDLHFRAGEQPWVRHGAVLAPESGQPVTTHQEMGLLADWSGGNDSSSSRQAVGRRWRVSAYWTLDGWRVALRIIPDQAPDFSQLGLDKTTESLIGTTSGLIVAAGPTGSGKTTTLAAIISRIINTQQIHLLTIEDPIEYLYHSKVAVVSQRDMSEQSTLVALQSAMRSDCDVILVGEIRAPEEAKMCLELAASGHLVLTTIHARDAGTVCERFATMTGKVGRSMLAQTLKAIISQRLLEASDSPQRRWLAAEVMIMSPAYRNMIRPEGSLTKIQAMLLDERKGMDNSIANLLLEGKISRATAMNNANNSTNLARLLSTRV